MTTYRHTDDMGEISGFGGGYEQCCQDMLAAGVQWLEANKGRDITAGRLQATSAGPDGTSGTTLEFYGVLQVDGADGKALERVILDAAKGEATGAMHQAVFERLMWIAEHGWDAYCQVQRDAEAKEPADRHRGGVACPS